jgi:hypothetical protein
MGKETNKPCCKVCTEEGLHVFYACPLPSVDPSLEPCDRQEQPEGLCVELDPCPIPEALDAANGMVMDFFSDIESLNVLPRNGGLADQPAAFVEGWRTYRHAMNICQNKRMEMQRKKNG